MRADCSEAAATWSRAQSRTPITRDQTCWNEGRAENVPGRLRAVQPPAHGVQDWLAGGLVYEGDHGALDKHAPRKAIFLRELRQAVHQVGMNPVKKNGGRQFPQKLWTFPQTFTHQLSESLREN